MHQTITLHPINNKKKIFAIGLIWLFHLSAMIGITLGYKDWFISKTPLNLLLAFALVAWFYPLNSVRKWVITGIFFVAGMLAEWIGVHYGFLFGDYYYGHNLGLKLDGVPWLIGINWAMLVLITGAVAHKYFHTFLWKVVSGATFMVVLDFLMEVSAPIFDFWVWETEEAPFQNYVAWFFIAAMLHIVYHRSRLQGDFLFSLHLYLTQLVFFAYFYVIHSY